MYFRTKKIIILLTIIAILSTGCVRRRMTVRSNPPGATVYLDGDEIGRTPFSTNFDYYGKREFRLVKDGYETKTVLLPIRAPWYQWIGIDFFTEVIFPGKLTDHKYYEFDMHPDPIVPPTELVVRAEDIRRQAHVDGALHVNDNGRGLVPRSSAGGSVSPYNTPETQYLTPSLQSSPILAPPSISPGDPNYAPPRI